jgi:gas vesicle protein
MSSEHNRGSRNFALGLMLGALIGAGATLLLAPHSGEETRRIIRKRARRIAGEASDRFDDIKDRIRQARRRAEHALTD